GVRVAARRVGGSAGGVCVATTVIIGEGPGASRRGGPPRFPSALGGVGLDWRRARPPIPMGIADKPYVEYLFPDPVGLDTTRLLYLPLGIGLLLVAGLGAGVWVIRRK